MSTLSVAIRDHSTSPIHLVTVGDAAVALRPFVPDVDRRFVIASWAKSAAMAAPRRLRRQVSALAWDEARALVDRASIVIACSVDAPATIHGWACGEPDVLTLHYAYTPAPLRRLGLARELVAACLREYPRLVRCSRPWPWRSDRYVLATHQEKAA